MKPFCGTFSSLATCTRSKVIRRVGKKVSNLSQAAQIFMRIKFLMYASVWMVVI